MSEYKFCSCEPKPDDRYMFCSRHLMVTNIVSCFIGYFIGYFIGLIIGILSR